MHLAAVRFTLAEGWDFPRLDLYRVEKGLTICPTSEIVCLPVLIFTYSHVENALFFALDLVVFMQLELLI